jgi:hypothetical protein
MSSPNAENLNFFTIEATRRINLQKFQRLILIRSWVLVVNNLLVRILLRIKIELEIGASALINKALFVCLDTKLAVLLIIILGVTLLISSYPFLVYQYGFGSFLIGKG